MKIGIDASRLAVRNRTGTENYAFQVIRGLLKIPQAYQLYFNQNPSQDILAALKLSSNTELKAMPRKRLWTHLRLSREMWQNPPNCLFVPAHVIPIVHPQRSIVTIHDLGYLYYPQAHPNHRYLDLSTRWSAKAAFRIIAVSQATKNDLIQHYKIPTDKIEVIYHGYDQAHYQPITDQTKRLAARQHYNISAERFLLYVGTLQPRKNLLRLLEAFANLAGEFKDVQLVLGGKMGWLGQPILDYIKSLEKSWPNRIVLTGYLDDADLPTLLSDAAAFIFPSLYEGFGMPVLEAMACGCPIVCSNSSSLGEVADQAALYHHPLDTHALENQIRRILSSEEVRQALKEGSLTQAAKFSWEKCAQQTYQVLTK